jgi:hypothetical protein
MSQERIKQMTIEHNTTTFINYQYSYMFQSHKVIVRLALEHIDIL